MGGRRWSQVLGKGAVREGFTEEVTLELSQAERPELTRQ